MLERALPETPLHTLSSDPVSLLAEKEGCTLPELLRELEERIIGDALKKTDGNVLRAAKLLGIPRQTLQYKLSQRMIPPC
ncbi:helix-turn-helix domain-containing protein [Brevibacillus agri]|uniref:helix-turn-helix domain-containing protein n=2 Tax=Brevibacillus TaxID=55080 RepID=UPI0025B6D7C7|nr:helix-turn-helix domain-containing protein [Brevibacillus agri]MDN4091639.1 helix-turn-helix domain-containing protein [Brevibacillus agri]